MVVNRYSDVSTSAYNPLSLQEILLVPQMKRQQHNQLDEYLLNTSGLIKPDPLDVHLNEANRIKSEYDQRIASQAESLARDGFTSSNLAQARRLNREVQNVMGPTGRIGQINQAKQIYNKNLNDYLEDATKNKGWSRERALYNWQQDVHNPYTGFDSGNNITNVNQYGAPKYVNVSEKVQEFAKQAGLSTREFARAAGALRFDQAGNRYVVNSSSEGVNANNYKQLQAIADTMTLELMNPNSEISRSIKFDGQSPQQTLSNIVQQLDIYKTDKQSQSSGYNIGSVDWYKPEEIEPNGSIISNDSTLTSDALQEQTYGDAIDSINKLKNSNSPVDRAKLDDLRELQSNAEAKALRDPKYVKLQSQYNSELNKWKGLANKMNLTSSERESVNTNPSILPQLLFSKGVGALKSNATSQDRELLMNGKNISKLQDLNTQKEKIQNDYWKQSSSVRHNYSYLPATPKQESEWNLYNENVYNALKGSNLSNSLDLTSIYTEGGSRKNITNKDVQNVETLIKSADPKTFKINNIKTYGDNKTPEVTVSFNTLKDTEEFDLDGVSWFNSGGDNYGGSEKPVTITFKLKNLSNSADTGSAPGYQNLSGAIADFWKNKGGVNQITGNPQGREVHSSIIENTYKSLSNEQLYQRAQTDPNAREALMIRVAKRK